MIVFEDISKLIFESDYFDLSDTLECGQTFRFKKVGNGYEIISGSKFCTAVQSGNRLTIESDDIAYFKNYFAFDVDYAAANADIVRIAPEFTDAAAAGKGIRLLRQDPFEMVISFIISANNNIPRIKGIIERISAAAGDKYDWGYAFPSRSQLCTLPKNDLKVLGTGYRASYIYEAARSVSDEFLTDVIASDTSAAMKKLLTVKGVGIKVADCIMLFGLGRGDTFPVDTWMEQALLSDTLDTNAKIRSHYISRFGHLAGLAQQYIYHYKRNIENKARTR